MSDKKDDNIYNYGYFIHNGYDLTDKNFCALSVIYPNSNNSIACDMGCYFKTEEGKKHIDWYLKNYPEQMKKCNCYKDE